MKTYLDFDLARRESVTVIVHKFDNQASDELVSCVGYDFDSIDLFHKLVFDTVKRSSDSSTVKVVTNPGGETVSISSKIGPTTYTHRIMYLVGNQA